MRSDTFRIGLGGGVGLGGLAGGDDDDIVTQTPRTISPEEPFYSVFTILSCCRHLIHIVTKLTSGLCELDLGISEIGRGDACFGDDDDIVLRTPRTICAQTPRNTSKAHPPTPRSGL